MRGVSVRLSAAQSETNSRIVSNSDIVKWRSQK